MYSIRSSEIALENVKNLWDITLFRNTKNRYHRNSIKTTNNLTFRKFSGKLEFQWLSASTLYCLLISSMLIPSFIIMLIDKINLVRSPNSDFDYKLFCTLNLLSSAPSFLLPFTCWFDTLRFLKYLNRWAEFEVRFLGKLLRKIHKVLLFQTDYNKIFKEKLNINVKKCCKNVVMFIKLYSLVIANLGVFFISEYKLWHIFSIYQMMVFCFIPFPYAGFITHILISTNSYMQHHFAKVNQLKFQKKCKI